MTEQEIVEEKRKSILQGLLVIAHAILILETRENLDVAARELSLACTRMKEQTR